MKIPRFLHCFYAFLMGYFWLPCPLCRRKFGGHERGAGNLMTSWTEAEGVCRDCAPTAEVSNAAFMAKDSTGAYVNPPGYYTITAPVSSTCAPAPVSSTCAPLALEFLTDPATGEIDGTRWPIISPVKILHPGPVPPGNAE